ncbi:MAG: hypothetical protein FJX25_04605 [Alphaproteobacteria bacterium]|nr:hypothetical protein [Alphaproteobacteria bacterium]
MPAVRPRETGWSLMLAATAASLLSLMVLGLLAVSVGHHPWQVLNVSSQWWHGPTDAMSPAVDAARTGLGGVTHVGACLFWSLVALILQRRLQVRTLGGVWLIAVATAAAAFAVDYGLLSRRLSPGWHLLLPWGPVAAGFAAMGLGIGLGLAASHVLFREMRPPVRPKG